MEYLSELSGEAFIDDFASSIPACRRLKDAIRAKQTLQSTEDKAQEANSNGEIVEDNNVEGTQTNIIHEETPNHSSGEGISNSAEKKSEISQESEEYKTQHIITPDKKKVGFPGLQDLINSPQK